MWGRVSANTNAALQFLPFTAASASARSGVLRAAMISTKDWREAHPLPPGPPGLVSTEFLLEGMYRRDIAFLTESSSGNSL